MLMDYLILPALILAIANSAYLLYKIATSVLNKKHPVSSTETWVAPEESDELSDPGNQSVMYMSKFDQDDISAGPEFKGGVRYLSYLSQDEEIGEHG